MVNLSHKLRKCSSYPKAAESSVNQTCLQGPFRLQTRGIVARPYMAMDSGLPCVVPSCEG